MAYYRSKKRLNISSQEQTGSIVTFNSQYAGLPLKSHKIAISSQSGVSDINISATGLNLWGGEAFYKPLLAHGATLYKVNKTVEYDGRVASNTGVVFDKFKPNTQYTLMLHVKSSNRNGNMAINYTDGTHQDVTFGTETGDYQYLFTTPSTKSVLNISFVWISYTTVIYYDEVCLLEGVHTVDDFVPFGTYTTIPIGSTINEGEYDARTGIFEATLPSVQTIQLPPCPIDTLQGENNIWADTGETTAEYIKIQP